MTKDEVIALATQAQIFLHHEDELDVVGMQDILRFAALVAAKEREECAQIADSAGDTSEGCDIAFSIRKRGEQ